ncbi:MAG: hypothetical protein IJ231_10725 [Clostridia bacterium]|nr:hypothetical protein [Clostridia bacterium]
MIVKIAEIKEFERMMEELATEIETAKGSIKAEMGYKEVLVSRSFKVTWKSVTDIPADTASPCGDD